jgi:hypothetical protein
MDDLESPRETDTLGDSRRVPSASRCVTRTAKRPLILITHLSERWRVMCNYAEAKCRRPLLLTLYVFALCKMRNKQN